MRPALAAAAIAFIAMSVAHADSGDLTWPSGARLRWAKDWYYADGGHLLWGKDLYYPGGGHLRWGKDLYYPTGDHLRWGKDLYLPGGTKRGAADAGTLVDWSDGTVTIRARREAGGPLHVRIVVAGAGFRLEHVEIGPASATRLWDGARTHVVDGDGRLFEGPGPGKHPGPKPYDPDDPIRHEYVPPVGPVGPHGPPRPIGPTPLGPPVMIPGWKPSPRPHPGPDAPYLKDPAARKGGKGPLELCGYMLDTVRWERHAGVFLALGRDGALWRVDARACHGAQIDTGVRAFAGSREHVMYVDVGRRAWFVSDDEVFHVASGAFTVRAEDDGFAVGLPKKVWLRLGAPSREGEFLRLHEEPFGRDVWLRPSREVVPSF